MVKKDVKVGTSALSDKSDITKFVNQANAFCSQLRLQEGTRQIDAKSLLGVMSLNARPGIIITVLAKGSDEKEAVATLIKLLK